MHEGEVLFVAGEAPTAATSCRKARSCSTAARNAIGDDRRRPRHAARRAGADHRNQAAGDRDGARAVDRDPHSAQPVPENARRLSGRGAYACAIRSRRGRSSAPIGRDARPTCAGACWSASAEHRPDQPAAAASSIADQTSSVTVTGTWSDGRSQPRASLVTSIAARRSPSAATPRCGRAGGRGRRLPSRRAR